MFVEHTPGQATLVRKIVEAFPGLSGAGKTSPSLRAGASIGNVALTSVDGLTW